ncbi:hypothetical protein GCM10018791_33900 [Streptomyces zaomyceticus]|nr:hypothetical protein GCM10018791_33900 [Streptomyces zaomyceticus]
MASARRMAWSSSWALSGARKSPVASPVTPVAMASCISRTCENTRWGHPNRRRRAGRREGLVCAGFMPAKVSGLAPGPEMSTERARARVPILGVSHGRGTRRNRRHVP